MILVDTSIWIDHLRHGDPVMQQLLDAQSVLMHPFVYGEISLGSLRDRQAYMLDLATLPVAPVVQDDEIHTLIERQRLFGTGIGLIDVHLLASTLIGDEDLLWTRDRRLGTVARRLGVDATSY
jgi:predicted nucleic acid-binding protein